MKITNHSGLDHALYDAIVNDPYSKGDADISVTGLLKPPRAAALERKHWDEIEEDASNRIWSLLGQVVHGILERANKTAIAERRLYVDVLGWKVSGGMDVYYEHGLLSDYKLTTCWKFKGDGVPIDFERQLNVYAEILRRNGERVNKLQIVGILRDWSKMEAQRDPEYPKTQVVVREVALWPAQQAWAFLEERVRMHQAARDALPECTAEDRWEKPTRFAVQKNGAAKALKLHDDENKAHEHAKQLGDEYSVQLRAGEQTRCKHFCSVSNFCDQYRGTGLFKLGGK